MHFLLRIFSSLNVYRVQHCFWVCIIFFSRIHSYSHLTSFILPFCSWFRQLFNNLFHSAPGLTHPTTLQPEPFGSDFNHYSYFILSHLTSIIIFIRSSPRQLFNKHNLTEPISLCIGYLNFLTSGRLVQCFNDWLCIFSNSQILPLIFFTHCCCPACCSFLENYFQIASILYIMYDYPILQRESWSMYISFMLDLSISDIYSWTWGWWPWCVECLPGLPCLLWGSLPALCPLPCWSLACCSAPALKSALPRAHRPRYHLSYLLHRACLGKDPHPCTVHGWAHWRCWMVVGRE